MRRSQFYLPTQKEVPSDAEIVSHQLMLRAGLIHKLGQGLYSWLPLGLRVLKKVETIVREEMDRIGAAEILMPAVQPARLWQESGRWENYGELLLKITDQNNREYCFGPTHEEVVTNLIRHDLRSYKQLPLTLYQIQTKFRDEIRPRFGVMRAREFLMKDAYSFHMDMESLDKTYQDMYQAYQRIFTRLGLGFRAVLADPGNIGGSKTHEFHVLADSGEDTILYSDNSEYAANLELATSQVVGERRPASKPLETIETPRANSIEALCQQLKIAADKTLKTLIVKGESTPLVALVLRGDHTVNPLKAEKHPAVAAPFCLASEDNILASTGTQPGFVGPVGLSMPIIADHHATLLSDFVCGANQTDKHLSGVNWQRDLPEPEVFDLRNAEPGDASPDGKGQLKQCRGIEVGHIFQLGDKYSKAMSAKALDSNGKAQELQMGCYGIGISRIVAASIEQNFDDRGIIWTDALAPFQLSLIPINQHKSPQVAATAEQLYQSLSDKGIDVLFDDRAERPGVLFAESDLIGMPHRLVISDKLLEQGVAEYKKRDEADCQLIPLSELENRLQELLK